MKQSTESPYTSRTAEQITPLSGRELSRFRTRGLRRRDRRPLSKIWPDVWSPKSDVYLNAIQQCQSEEEPTTSEGKWSLINDGDASPRFDVIIRSGALQICDAMNGSLLIALPSDTPWLVARPLEDSLIEERGFFHIERSRQPKHTKRDQQHNTF